MANGMIYNSHSLMQIPQLYTSKFLFGLLGHGYTEDHRRSLYQKLHVNSELNLMFVRAVNLRDLNFWF